MWLLAILAAAIFLLGVDHSRWLGNVASNVKRLYALATTTARGSVAGICSKYVWLVLGITIGLFGHLAVAKLPAFDWRQWVPVVGPVVPDAPPAPVKPTKVTYVYEKDQGGIPSGVAVALDKLNRQGIMATTFEDDTTNAQQQVPAQYRIAKAEAEKLGMPALVVQSGDEVLRVVKVKTETETLEAAK